MAGFFAGVLISLRRARDKMKKLGATSEETAKRPEELGVSKEALESLKNWKIVKETEDGRYYLGRDGEEHS